MGVAMHVWVFLVVAAQPVDVGAWSCTMQTLARGVPCLFADDAAPPAGRWAQRNANRAQATTLARSLCDDAARMSSGAVDPDLAAACASATARAAATCEGDGRAPVLDARGRFPASQAACYAALQGAVTTTRDAAATWGDCCACLAASSCTKGSAACAAALASGRAAPAPEQCLVDGACAPVCAGAAAQTALVEATRPASTSTKKSGARAKGAP